MKERIRTVFYPWFARKWSPKLLKCELHGDRVLLQLESGLRFCALSELRDKWDVFGWLHEQLTAHHLYERYYKPKRGDVVVDAGAGPCGVYTVLAAKSVGAKGLVIAIEPEIGNVKNINENIKLNKLGNVVVISKGLWNKREQEMLDTLDNILRGLGVEKVNFIKMDIEGAEIKALEGMERTLENTDVNLAIAAYHMVNCSPTCVAVIPKLEERGFNVCEHDGFVYAMRRHA